MLISILSYLGIACLCTKYFKVKFIHSLPASLSLIIVFLYVGVMSGALSLATYFLYILGTASLFICAYLDKKELMRYLRQYSFEITAWLSVILIYAFFTKDAYFSSWDDFSHWGIFSKELLLSNTLETSTMPTSILSSHAHYPRGPAYIIILC